MPAKKLRPSPAGNGETLRGLEGEHLVHLASCLEWRQEAGCLGDGVTGRGEEGSFQARKMFSVFMTEVPHM